MMWRQVGSIILNILSLLPVLFLTHRYGLEARVPTQGPEAFSVMLAIAGSVAGTFVVALAGSLLLSKAGPPTLLDLMKLVAEAERRSSRDRRQTA